ncbi:MAG: hypothetical protein RLZZ127_78 [Planctomycetota bacterium]|jgi:AcrR family transcriptional regulator
MPALPAIRRAAVSPAMEREPADAVRDGLVAAARGYFLRFGYSRVSTSEIAEQAGRSKKTLYQHFPSKEQLLAAVVDDIRARCQDEVLSLLGAPGPAADRIRSVLERLGAHQAALSATLLPDLARSEPQLAQRMRQEQRAALDDLTGRILDHGIQAGVFRADIDRPAAVATYLASAEALGQASALAEHAADPAALFRQLVGWMMAGLAAR